VIDSIPFGADQHGAPVRLWRLHNAAGATACISELGATLVRLDAPDRHGQLADIALGFDSAEAYLADDNYIGCIVGRYAGRIAGGRFEIDGRVYQAPCNEGPNLLHGGNPGFHRKLWRASIEAQSLRLDLVSPDGDAGFPGEVRVTARYTFTDNFELILSLEAHTNASTPFNLTHHAYWNLAGAGAPSVLDHELSIAAARYAPVGESMIHTGTIDSVDNSPFDFRRPKTIGRDIGADDAQLDIAGGYDHTFVTDGVGMRPILTLAYRPSGRSLTLHSDLPCLHLYSLKAPRSPIHGKGGAFYRARSALALEPRGLPGGPNSPDFSPLILRCGDAYSATLMYAFEGGP
jgi:aldose 1-epimerase